MKTTSWHEKYRELEKVGVDKLTAEEKGLRRLPIDKVTTIEVLFQPRLLEGGEEGAGLEASRSGKHLGVLQRSLQNQERLSPITVVKIGGQWVCCDGYHRLMAYRMEAKRLDSMNGVVADPTYDEKGQLKRVRARAYKTLTHIPVTVFGGTFEEAYHLSVSANAQDKLNMSEPEKMEACWRRVILGLDVKVIQVGTTMSRRTIFNMKKLLAEANEHHPKVDFATWTYARVKELSKNWVSLGDHDDHWMEKKAQEWSRAIAKTFKGLPTQHPAIFARALVLYNREMAGDVADQIIYLRDDPQ
jgi:hypothetical protein